MAHIHVRFPARAMLGSVASALAISAGARFDRRDIGTGSFAPRIPSLDLSSSPNVPEMARISFMTEAGDLMKATYHFEFGGNGERGMLLPETPTWLALAQALVECFGGAIDLEREGESRILSVEDKWPADAGDAGFDALQKLVFGVRRITREDIKAAEAVLSRD